MKWNMAISDYSFFIDFKRARAGDNPKIFPRIGQCTRPNFNKSSEKIDWNVRHWYIQIWKQKHQNCVQLISIDFKLEIFTHTRLAHTISYVFATSAYNEACIVDSSVKRNIRDKQYTCVTLHSVAYVHCSYHCRTITVRQHTQINSDIFLDASTTSTTVPLKLSCVQRA